MSHRIGIAYFGVTGVPVGTTHLNLFGRVKSGSNMRFDSEDNINLLFFEREP